VGSEMCIRDRPYTGFIGIRMSFQTEPSDTFARANATPPSRRNRGKMKFSAPGPAGSYGKGPLYGNTFARADRAAGLSMGGRAIGVRRLSV